MDEKMRINRELLKETAALYAAGADKKDRQIWQSVLAADCEIEGDGFHHIGRDVCLTSIDLLADMFRRTHHQIHQQLVTIQNDTAFGETYATAEHLLKEEDAILVWQIRYQDKWRKEQGAWLFTHRKLIVDWQESRSVIVSG